MKIRWDCAWCMKWYYFPTDMFRERERRPIRYAHRTFDSEECKEQWQGISCTEAKPVDHVGAYNE